LIIAAPQEAFTDRSEKTAAIAELIAEQNIRFIKDAPDETLRWEVRLELEAPDRAVTGLGLTSY